MVHQGKNRLTKAIMLPMMPMMFSFRVMHLEFDSEAKTYMLSLCCRLRTLFALHNKHHQTNQDLVSAFEQRGEKEAQSENHVFVDRIVLNRLLLSFCCIQGLRLALHGGRHRQPVNHFAGAFLRYKIKGMHNGVREQKRMLCLISQFYPHVSSSFEHSFFSMKAYFNLQKLFLSITVLCDECFKTSPNREAHNHFWSENEFPNYSKSKLRRF